MRVFSFKFTSVCLYDGVTHATMCGGQRSCFMKFFSFPSLCGWVPGAKLGPQACVDSPERLASPVLFETGS